MASLTSDILKQCCYISRRDEDPNEGFQRVLNVARARSIAKYLEADGGQIPSPIIVSAKDEASVKMRGGKISFSLLPSVFLVIDGQHRLYGLTLLSSPIEYPVVIFQGLSLEDEVSLFIDVNTNQKGVSTSLLLDIQSLRGNEAGKEAEKRRIFDLINKDSVLAGRLSPTSSAKGKISRKTFYDFTDPLLDSIYFEGLTPENKYLGLKNYLEACSSLLDDSNSQRQRLYNSVIFKSFMILLGDVIEKCYKKHENFKTESFFETLSPASSIDFDQYTGTNNVTMNRIVADIKRELLQAERGAAMDALNLF